MIPDCDRQTVGQTESIIAKTALCIASYADALPKMEFLTSREMMCRWSKAILNDNTIICNLSSFSSVIACYLVRIDKLNQVFFRSYRIGLFFGQN